MGTLAGGTAIWLYSELDQAVYNWMATWAKTLGVPGTTSKTIWRVFATPDRAFSMMYKVLLKAGMIDSKIPEHEASIPLPFYSITRLDPVPEPSRDLSSHFVRAYKTAYIRCPYCHYILSLAELATGVCPSCHRVISEDLVEQFTYDWETKTKAQLLVDKWHFVGSDRLPEPFLIQYQLDFWCKTFGEAQHQAMTFARQFRKGDMILDVDYPEPMGTQPTYFNNYEIRNNTDLEPGEDTVNVRYSFTFDCHGWLYPIILRTGVVKVLPIEVYNLEGTVLFERIPDAFKTYGGESE